MYKRKSKEKAPLPEIYSPVAPVVIHRGLKDYIWLFTMISLFAATALLWPVWHYLVGADPDDYYSMLGVSADADKGVIKRAYKQLARQWHPDHNPGCGEQCRERMRTITDAYKSLLAGNTQPGAGREKGENNELCGTLLHLFLGRLFDTSIFFGEFMVAIFPPLYEMQILRTGCVLGGVAALYFHLMQVQVHLSYIGIMVCVYRFYQLPHYAPGVRARNPTYFETVLLVVPAFLLHIGSLTYFNGFWVTVNSGKFWIGTLAGIMALTSFLIRSMALIITHLLKKVTPISGWNGLCFFREIATNDLLLHLIKIPAPYRIFCLVSVAAYLYQRWIYPVVSIQQLQQVATLHGMDTTAVKGTNKVTTEAMTAEQAAKEREQQGTKGSVEVGDKQHIATEATPKLTKKEKLAKQRQSGGEGGSNCGKMCLFLIFITFTLLITLGPWFLSTFSDSELIPKPVQPKKEDTGKQPTGEHERYNYANARRPGDKPKEKPRSQKSSKKGTSSKKK